MKKQNPLSRLFESFFPYVTFGLFLSNLISGRQILNSPSFWFSWIARFSSSHVEVMVMEISKETFFFAVYFAWTFDRSIIRVSS